MKRKKVPEPFHPGEYLKDELEARGWSVAKLAEKIGQHFTPLSPCYTCLWLGGVVVDLKQIIAGQISISPQMAEYLGKALGTGAEVWLNLQNAYNLTKEIRSARRKR